MRYERLIAHPEVQAMLQRASGRTDIRISAEQFIKIYDKYLCKAVGGVALGDMTEVLLPILKKAGVKTGKTRTEFVMAPVGRTIVGTLCSLTRRESKIKEVHQARDGCVIESSLPSDLFAWEGTAVITIASQDHRTRVDALARIEGQMFDWGKSNRWLDHLFTEIHGFSGPNASKHLPPPPLSRTAGQGILRLDANDLV